MVIILAYFRIVQINPDDWNYLYTKGLGYYRQGRINEAHEITKKAWDLRSHAFLPFSSMDARDNDTF
jgi:tetratricopeptide (TPR) repeat protein